MTAAVRALTWEIFARHRWIVGGTGIYLFVVCLVVPLLPEWAQRKELSFCLIAPLILGITCLLSALCYGEETQLEQATGGLPRRLLLLPVSIGVIVLVPLCLSLVLFMSVWSMLAIWVLRPCGAAVPLVWPGLLAAVALAWLMALCWTPLPHPWVRLGLIAVWGLGSVIGMLFLIEKIRPTESALVLMLGGLWPPAVGLALVGVRRTRSGGCAAEWGISSWIDATQSTRVVSPFRSPLASLGWLEWRLHGRPMVYLSLFYLGLLLPMATATDYVLRYQPYVFEAMATNPTVYALGPAWSALSWQLLVPLITALAGGGGAAVYDTKQKQYGLPLFVAVRPVSTEDLMRAKFIAAARHLLLLWTLMLVGAGTWAVLGGHTEEMVEGLVTVCGSPALAVLIVLGLSAGVYASTYLIYIGSMWMGLVASMVGTVIPVVVNVVLFCLGIALAMNWKQGWLQWLQVALWVALTFKILAVIYLVRLNVKRRLVCVSTLVGGLAIWVALVVPCALGSLGFGVGGYTPALAVVVLLPLAQTLLAPVAMHRGRHGSWA